MRRLWSAFGKDHTLRSMLAATLVLGGGSIITSLIGVLAAKCWALMVGPGGVGEAAMLLGISGLLGTLAGLSLGNGLLRLGPELLALSNKRAFQSLVTCAWIILLATSTSVTATLFTFDRPISEWIGYHFDKRELACLAIIITANAATALQNGVINATHDIRTLAWSSILGALASLLSTIALLAAMGPEGVAPALALGSIGTWSASWFAYRSTMHKHTGERSDTSHKDDVDRHFVRELCSFAIPFSISCLLGAGIQQLLPVIIAKEMGIDMAGIYRAASTIGIGYIGVILTALGQDFFPRIAAAKRDSTAVRTLLIRQIRFSVALLLPIILMLIVCKEWLIIICYSHDFLPAASLLPWFALGSLPKVISWCVSYAIMATAPGWVFLISEITTGMVWLASALVCMRWWGLDGLGIAYVIAYITHMVLVGIILLCCTGHRPKDQAGSIDGAELGTGSSL